MRGYIEFIVRFRWLVLAVILGLTGFFYVKGQTLTVIIDPNNIVPRDHPFIATTLKVEEVFGSRYVAVIGITPKQGDVFQPEILAKVQRITQKLRETPRIVKTNLLSVSARRAKDIRGTAEGMEVLQMMPTVPSTPEEMAALKEALLRNTSYMNSVVSSDFKTLTILAEVRDASAEDKKEGRVGFTYVNNKINEAVDPERDDTVEIEISGYPPFLSTFEKFAGRSGLLLLIAIGIIGIIHFEAFRTLQGLILPLVTPIIAVTWAKGFMGLAGVPLDIFNMSTPILVLAVGAGHAVQLLKRYYEEYNFRRPNGATYVPTKFFTYTHHLGKYFPYLLGATVIWGIVAGIKAGEWAPGLAAAVKAGTFILIPVWIFLLWAAWRLIVYIFMPQKVIAEKECIQANRDAVVESIVKIGPVMLTAGIVAACGFFSLVVFDIVSIRVFGVFSGLGILSVLIVEMTFIPALRAILPPPSQRETRLEREERFWDRITGFYANTMLSEKRNWIFVITGVLIVVSLIGISQLKIESALKRYFSPDLQLLKDDAKLNERMAGTNNIYITIEGDEIDAIKNPAVLQAMDELQDFINKQPHVGKVMSLAEFIKRMNQSIHADDPAYYRIPDNQNTIAEYLLLYSMSGEPGDFDPYVDYDYQIANMVVFTHSDSTADMLQLWDEVQKFAAEKFPPNIKINVGGSVAQSAALVEVIVKDKILNIIQIAAVVFVIASLVFRSPVAGLLVVTPLLLSVLTNMGLMGLLGINLNIPTALTSALAIGIGADYAIYMLFRLREELSKGTEVDAAFRKVLRTAGKACLFVASAVAGGYAVQAFSRGYYPHTWTALLIGTGMLVSVTAALTIMPSLVLKFRPKFIFNGASRMKANSGTAAVAAIIGVSALLSFAPRDAHAIDPVEIMQKNFMVNKVIDARMETTMTLTNKAGKQRVRKTFGTTKLQENGVDNMRMTRFMEPADVKGTVSLLIEHADEDDDIWIYLPSLKKVRRLISSNKKDSFVGTDFSYGDVIGHKVKEWNHTLTKEEEVDGVQCYVIESTPIDKTIQRNTGYSKRVSWIQKDNFVTRKAVMYDEAGDLLKEMRFTRYKEVDPERHKWQAGDLEAHNVQTGHSTHIHSDKYEPNVGVKDTYFTTRYMEQP